MKKKRKKKRNKEPNGVRMGYDRFCEVLPEQLWAAFMADGRSCDEVADATGISRSAVFAALNGTRMPGAYALRQYAMELNVSTDFLLRLGPRPTS